jgi:hypothetical protein
VSHRELRGSATWPHPHALSVRTRSAGERRPYPPRAAEREVLHTIVPEHLETFLREAAHRSGGAGLPHFVEQEFRDFLTCGVLAHGFARVRCGTCAFERLVPFSCKGRGFCPSCRGRRMAERAAHLVGEVLPRVPVRPWVLRLPHRLRYLLARNHALCRAVLGVYCASRNIGVPREEDAQSGGELERGGGPPLSVGPAGRAPRLR